MGVGEREGAAYMREVRCWVGGCWGEGEACMHACVRALMLSDRAHTFLPACLLCMRVHVYAHVCVGVWWWGSVCVCLS